MHCFLKSTEIPFLLSLAAWMRSFLVSFWFWLVFFPQKVFGIFFDIFCFGFGVIIVFVASRVWTKS